MIPELTMNVLTTGFGHVGTATIDKKSYHTDTMGVSVDQQNDTISCFVKKSFNFKTIFIFYRFEIVNYIILRN